jgi:acetyltransferase-like isoleucine patch superfamily enzyme
LIPTKILSNNKKIKNFVFSWYSYLKEFEIAIMNITLPPFRKAYFKMRMRNFNMSSNIDYGFYFRYPNKISIGKNVEINRNCSFYPSFLLKKGEIHIGDNVIIAPSVSLYCAGHSRLSISRENVADDIWISDDSYIGANSIIRYGVTIGAGATIAAGSVVVNDVPPGEAHGGNPARKIE